MLRNPNPTALLEKSLWEREYSTLKVIPSSARTSPSKALRLFSQLIDFTTIHRVLDVGCGIGRNSVYLAQKGCDVFAIDFCDTALTHLINMAKKAGVIHDIHPTNCLLQDYFPFRDRSFELVLDSYVFCHFTEEPLKKHYRNELHRVTKPGGIIYISLFSTTDGYYRPMITRPEDPRVIVVDPHNGIKKQLYTEQDIKAFFCESFTLLYFVNLEFEDLVLGQPYWRSVFALLLRK